MTQRVFLLRGINVGGNKKVPMAELRALTEGLGFEDPRTVLASGNLVVSTRKKPGSAAKALGAAIRDHFGFDVDVIGLAEDDFRAIAADHGAFPDARAERPKLLHVGFVQTPVGQDVANALAARAAAGERVALADGMLVIDYADGVARSKLDPKSLDRAAGQPVTCRNVNTLARMVALLDASP